MYAYVTKEAAESHPDMNSNSTHLRVSARHWVSFLRSLPNRRMRRPCAQHGQNPNASLRERAVRAITCRSNRSDRGLVKFNAVHAAPASHVDAWHGPPTPTKSCPATTAPQHDTTRAEPQLPAQSVLPQITTLYLHSSRL
jgi:hypothetical protein